MDGCRIKALLFDLDDTLLVNDMATFTPHYMRALTSRLKKVLPPKQFLRALDIAMRAMFRNDGMSRTNAEVFADAFFPHLDRAPDEIMSAFDAFYAEDYDALSKHVEVDPDARVLMDLVVERGYRVAIATQPVFPLQAILARLRWANVGVSEYHYDFVSCYENMCACKPHPRYFLSIVEHLGCVPQECMMIGDSPEADMPARRLGLKTFWVDRRRTPRYGITCDSLGNLRDLINLIKTGKIDEL